MRPAGQWRQQQLQGVIGFRQTDLEPIVAQGAHETGQPQTQGGANVIGGFDFMGFQGGRGHGSGHFP